VIGLRPSGDRRKDREDFPDFEATVIFGPNPEAGQPYKNDWLAEHDGTLVFSSDELDALIKGDAALRSRVERAQPIWVRLKRTPRASYGRGFFHAFPIPEKTVSEEVVSSSAGTDQPQVAVFIDGQNFLFALQQLLLRFPDKETVVEVLKRILASYRAEIVNFYICQAVDHSTLDPLVALLRDSIEGIGIIDRPMKVVGGNGLPSDRKAKSDIDGWLIPDLTAEFYEKPGLGGVVLVAGDSDYLPALERCWLSENHGGPKRVEVVSSQGTVAREYRDHPGITLRLLEGLMPTTP